MAEKTSKTGSRTTKRPAKGLRTHLRRMKQIANKGTIVNKTPSVRQTPEK
jgi:hypothetical protein